MSPLFYPYTFLRLLNGTRITMKLFQTFLHYTCQLNICFIEMPFLFHTILPLASRQLLNYIKQHACQKSTTVTKQQKFSNISLFDCLVIWLVLPVRIMSKKLTYKNSFDILCSFIILWCGLWWNTIFYIRGGRLGR